MQWPTGKLKARASHRVPRVTPREDTSQGARHKKDLIREKVVRERMARARITLVPNSERTQQETQYLWGRVSAVIARATQGNFVICRTKRKV